MKNLENDIKNSLKLNEPPSPPLEKTAESKSDIDLKSFKNNNIDVITPISSEILKNEMESVALEWKAFRNIVECSCMTPFDHSSRKVRLLLLFLFV